MNRRSVEDDKFNKVGWNKGGGGGRGKRSRKKMENNIDSIVKKERNGIKWGRKFKDNKFTILKEKWIW